MSEERLSRLEGRLEGLERRLSLLESRIAPESDAPVPQHDLPPVSTSVSTRPDPDALPGSGPADSGGSSAGADSSMVSLLGRFLVILGGAFLLRAGTDAGTFPPGIGISLGIAYGLVQIVLASRFAGRGLARSANWFGFGAAVILLPLIVESTLKFHILSTGLASLLLPVLGFLGVAVAAKSRLRTMAWVFMAGAGTIGLFLAIRTGFGLGFPLGVLLVGLGGLWLGYLRGWYGLAIVGSLVPVAMVMAITLLVALEIQGSVTNSLSPRVALILQMALVSGFLGSFLARALKWSAPVSVPEVMQAILATLIGIVGALVSAHKDPSLRPAFGSFMLATGVFSYLVSFLRIDRREGHRGNFAFFSSAAIVAMLTATALIFDGWVELGVLLVAAMGLAFAGARLHRATLSLHAAIYVVGAGFASGLMQKALDALTGAMATPPTGAGLLRMIVVFVVSSLCCGAPVVHEGKTWGRLSRLPKAVYLLFLLITIDGVLALFLADRFAGLPGGEGFDPGIVAAMRTGLLAISAVIMASISRAPRLREGAFLVPLALVLGGAALVFGDLRSGRPATQFVSLALYGLALILAPRMARNAQKLSS